MKTLFNETDRRAILERIERLMPRQAPEWGSMSAHRMVCHLGAALRFCLASECPRRARGPLAHPPLNWLVIYVLPWPKGKAQSPPEFLALKPTTWEADVGTLRDLIEQFGARRPTEAWPPSVAFGRMSGRAWGVLHYRHLDHHFRQFGV